MEQVHASIRGQGPKNLSHLNYFLFPAIEIGSHFGLLPPQFDTVSDKSDGSGMESKKVQTSGTYDGSSFLMACGEFQTFIMAHREKPPPPFPELYQTLTLPNHEC